MDWLHGHAWPMRNLYYEHIFHGDLMAMQGEMVLVVLCWFVQPTFTKMPLVSNQLLIYVDLFC